MAFMQNNNFGNNNNNNGNGTGEKKSFKLGVHLHASDCIAFQIQEFDSSRRKQKTNGAMFGPKQRETLLENGRFAHRQAQSWR